MSTFSPEQQPTRVWPAALLLMGSLVPALLAVLPLTMGPAWYLSAEENELYLTGGRVVWLLTVFAIALTPFSGVIVSLLSVRAVGRDWAQGCRIAAAWGFGLGCLAFGTAMVYAGGL
jgi:hypothetical protein